MLKVVIEKKNNRYGRLSCLGHAGFAKRGDDIVCAAASILIINTLNSMEKLAGARFEVMENQKAGQIEAVFPEDLNEGAQLLLDSMEMGLSEISRQYGRKYITLEVKEAALC